jgi:hypothetical protein
MRETVSEKQRAGHGGCYCWGREVRLWLQGGSEGMSSVPRINREQTNDSPDFEDGGGKVRGGRGLHVFIAWNGP